MQQYCLRWKYHHSNLQTMFSSLLDRGCFCDVTLACEEQMIRAHRVVLCACSVYFDTILTNHANERNPIIIMKDARFNEIKCLIEFMYKGEINVEHVRVLFSSNLLKHFLSNFLPPGKSRFPLKNRGGVEDQGTCRGFVAKWKNGTGY